MEWVVLGIGVLTSAELFLRLPLNRSLGVLKLSAQKALSIIKSSNISDHWKEKVLPRYAFQIFKNSLISFFLLLLAVIPFGVLMLILEQTEIKIIRLAISLEGLVFATVICIIYLLIRRRVY